MSLFALYLCWLLTEDFITEVRLHVECNNGKLDTIRYANAYKKEVLVVPSQ
jgi:hypothetical protein